MKLVALLASFFLLSGCVSPSFCKDEAIAQDFGRLKCGLAVGADVVLGIGAIALIAAGAKSTADQNHYDSNQTSNLTETNESDSSVTNAQQQVVCATYVSTNKKYKTPASIVTGDVLNQKLSTYKFVSYAKYVVIFWSKDQASIIKLANSYGPSSYGTSGTDQRGYEWNISTSTAYCY